MNINGRLKLQQIMEAQHMSAKQFAEEVGISAGTISNIMGGRNNPSYEVMQAVLNRFRTISADWLVLDSGPMYRPNGDVVQQTLFDIPPIEQPKKEPESAPAPAPAPQPVDMKPVVEKKVAKIVIYYTDGTYEER